MSAVVLVCTGIFPDKTNIGFYLSWIQCNRNEHAEKCSECQNNNLSNFIGFPTKHSILQLGKFLVSLKVFQA